MKKLIIIVCILVSGNSYSQKLIYGEPNPGSPLSEVFQAEKWFSKSCAQIGLFQTTIKYMAEDGILFMPDPVKAKSFMKQIPEEHIPPVFSKNYPVFIDVAESNDFAYVIGVCEFQSNMPHSKPLYHGYYVTIMEKQNDGNWRAIAAQDADMVDKLIDNFEVKFSFYAGQDIKKEFVPIKNKNEVEKDIFNLDISNNLDFQKNMSLETYKSFLASNATVIRDGNTWAKSPNEISKFFQNVSSFKWVPIASEVANSGDLGYSIGKFFMKEANTIKEGYYLHVWKRQKNGDWKMVVDIMSEPQHGKKSS